MFNITPRQLYLRETTPVPKEYETWCALEPVWTFRKGENLLLLLEFETRNVQTLI
jgi:hypothetical protein